MEAESCERAEVSEKTNSKSVSFSIDFDEPAKKPARRPPRALTNNHAKKVISEASLEKKQRLAEERRKVHM